MITTSVAEAAACLKDGQVLAYPTEAVEYVIVHELAHIKHHNHNPAFYALIEKYMPDYKKRQKLLKIN